MATSNFKAIFVAHIRELSAEFQQGASVSIRVSFNDYFFLLKITEKPPISPRRYRPKPLRCLAANKFHPLMIRYANGLADKPVHASLKALRTQGTQQHFTGAVFTRPAG